MLVRSTIRDGYVPTTRDTVAGFRLARTMPFGKKNGG
jgi:hypothetical protein